MWLCKPGLQNFIKNVFKRHQRRACSWAPESPTVPTEQFLQQEIYPRASPFCPALLLLPVSTPNSWGGRPKGPPRGCGGSRAPWHAAGCRGCCTGLVARRGVLHPWGAFGVLGVLRAWRGANEGADWIASLIRAVRMGRPVAVGCAQFSGACSLPAVPGSLWVPEAPGRAR